MHGDVDWLHAVLSLDEELERAVDPIVYRRDAAKIYRKPTFDTILSLDEGFERAVDPIEYRRVAAKICRKPAFDTVLRFDDFPDDFEIGLDVGAAEGIDRLFRVADHEYFSGNHFEPAPIHRGLVGVLGQVEENLILNRIGVLKFVDEDRTIAPFKLCPHALLVAHEVARAHQQAVERKMSFADK